MILRNKRKKNLLYKNNTNFSFLIVDFISQVIFLKKKFNQFLIIITFLFCGIIMIQNLKRRGGKKPQYYKR